MISVLKPRPSSAPATESASSGRPSVVAYATGMKPLGDKHPRSLTMDLSPAPSLPETTTTAIYPGASMTSFLAGNVRYWHFADTDTDAEHVSSKG